VQPQKDAENLTTIKSGKSDYTGLSLLSQTDLICSSCFDSRSPKRTWK